MKSEGLDPPNLDKVMYGAYDEARRNGINLAPNLRLTDIYTVVMQKGPALLGFKLWLRDQIGTYFGEQIKNYMIVEAAKRCLLDLRVINPANVQPSVTELYSLLRDQDDGGVSNDIAIQVYHLLPEADKLNRFGAS